MKNFTITIQGERDDDLYSITVNAPSLEEAAKLAHFHRLPAEQGKVVEITGGASKAAAALENALRPIIWQLERMDDLPTELEEMIYDGKRALDRCKSPFPQWGSLHYDGSLEPTWWLDTVSLEIGGCRYTSDNTGIDSGFSDEEAQFWTIYSRDREGLAHALQDCCSRKEANFVLSEMTLLLNNRKNAEHEKR